MAEILIQQKNSGQNSWNETRERIGVTSDRNSPWIRYILPRVEMSGKNNSTSRVRVGREKSGSEKLKSAIREGGKTQKTSSNKMINSMSGDSLQILEMNSKYKRFSDSNKNDITILFNHMNLTFKPKFLKIFTYVVFFLVIFHNLPGKFRINHAEIFSTSYMKGLDGRTWKN